MQGAIDVSWQQLQVMPKISRTYPGENSLADGVQIHAAARRLDAPFGTEDKPVEVTSSFGERIVGVPDPYDDSIVWWGNIHEGDPPKQIVEGGEFFVLKRLGDVGHGH